MRWTALGPTSLTTSDSYTPWAGDEGNYLQATASYADAIGEDKSAMAVTVVVYLRVMDPEKNSRVCLRAFGLRIFNRERATRL